MKSNKIIRILSLTGLIGILGCVPQKEELSLSRIADEMEIIRTDYSNSLSQVESTMRNVFEGRYFSEENQLKVYNLLKYTKDKSEKYDKLKLKCPEQPYALEFPTNRFEYFPLLEKNVTGIDGGSPEIQKYFDSKYPGFKADPIFSPGEKEAVEEAINIALEVL
ncbi:hypothetical protein HYW75_06940 [Candidatus Pacearchaeota archaeon]|nr:hypothetical protein [Candidatus Pacearchaeota archaeon]